MDEYQLEKTILCQLDKIDTLPALEALRVSVLGKKGTISESLKNLALLSGDDRKHKAKILNELKEKITFLITQKRDFLKKAALTERLSSETIDVTLPVRSGPLEEGRIHPISQVIDEIIAIFSDLGFAIAEGPDIETEYYNFTALNFPLGHPARDMHDSFFLQETHKSENKERETHKSENNQGLRKLLRTHTSPVQIRTMEKQKPPIRIVIPGKTYRVDSDATHSPMFHQLEGLVIDKNANMAHMMWLLEQFCKHFFEVPNVQMRFRPSFFPFTEPSLEVDIQCHRTSSSIQFGTGTDWLEILGCGMVHPHVLKNGGLDPEEYQGFAWGIGIDRIAMLKYGMPDLRAFFQADIRWLHHYGFRPLDIPALFSGLSQC